MLSEYITSLADVRFHMVALHVRAVSVFGKKSDAVCGFLAYFSAVLRFSDPPYVPLAKHYSPLKTRLYQRAKHCGPQKARLKAMAISQIFVPFFYIKIMNCCYARYAAVTALMSPYFCNEYPNAQSPSQPLLGPPH